MQPTFRFGYLSDTNEVERERDQESIDFVSRSAPLAYHTLNEHGHGATIRTYNIIER